MKLRDLLTLTSECIRQKRSFVDIDGKRRQIKAMPGGYMALHVNQQVTVECVSAQERSLAGQAAKNFGFIILRVHGLPGLAMAGSVNGKYVDDVEFECTRLLLQETV